MTYGIQSVTEKKSTNPFTNNFQHYLDHYTTPNGSSQTRSNPARWYYDISATYMPHIFYTIPNEYSLGAFTEGVALYSLKETSSGTWRAEWIATEGTSYTPTIYIFKDIRDYNLSSSPNDYGIMLWNENGELILTNTKDDMFKARNTVFYRSEGWDSSSNNYTANDSIMLVGGDVDINVNQLVDGFTREIHLWELDGTGTNYTHYHYGYIFSWWYDDTDNTIYKVSSWKCIFHADGSGGDLSWTDAHAMEHNQILAHSPLLETDLQ